jgi:hypothetical protein
VNKEIIPEVGGGGWALLGGWMACEWWCRRAYIHMHLSRWVASWIYYKGVDKEIIPEVGGPLVGGWMACEWWCRRVYIHMHLSRWVASWIYYKA